MSFYQTTLALVVLLPLGISRPPRLERALTQLVVGEASVSTLVGLLLCLISLLFALGGSGGVRRGLERRSTLVSADVGGREGTGKATHSDDSVVSSSLSLHRLGSGDRVPNGREGGHADLVLDERLQLECEVVHLLCEWQ